MVEREPEQSGSAAAPELRTIRKRETVEDGASVERGRRVVFPAAAASGPDAWHGRGSGLAPNRAAALAYLAGPFTGALFLVLDEDDAYVRFHSLQSIALTVAWVALWIVVTLVGLLLGFLPFIGGALAVFLRFVVAAGSFGVWLACMTKAYRGQEWEIPFLGPLVRRLEDMETEGEAG